MSDPRQATNPLGIDLGIALSIATSAGDTHVSPNEGRLDWQIRRSQRETSRIVSAAIATGRAGVRCKRRR